MPVVAINFRTLYAWSTCADEKLAVLTYFAPLILAWLDKTMVSGSKANRRTVRRIYRDYASFANFTLLVNPSGMLLDAALCQKRLRGLVNCEVKP